MTPSSFINGSNHSAIRLANGDELYFSYRTLIALRKGEKCYVTSKRWSNTTTRHQSKMGVSGWEKIDQNDLEKLAQ
jgi:hypothetical protein